MSCAKIAGTLYAIFGVVVGALFRGRVGGVRLKYVCTRRIGRSSVLGRVVFTLWFWHLSQR